ncbi:rod shape-determining protein, partial [Rhizobium sp. KAs_5_22]
MNVKDIGIDLGTRNTLISIRGEGIVINEPSCLAIDRTTLRPIAYGKKAYEMIGRTSQDVDVIFPLQGGVI